MLYVFISSSIYSVITSLAIIPYTPPRFIGLLVGPVVREVVTMGLIRLACGLLTCFLRVGDAWTSIPRLLL
jgi:hypothetical protein